MEGNGQISVVKRDRGEDARPTNDPEPGAG